jgi:hypothetical protein
VLCHVGGDFRVPDDSDEVRRILKQSQYGRQFLLPRDAPVLTGFWAMMLARIARDKRHEVMYAFLRAKIVSLLHPSPDNSQDGHAPCGVDSGSNPVG